MFTFRIESAVFITFIPEKLYAYRKKILILHAIFTQSSINIHI